MHIAEVGGIDVDMQKAEGGENGKAEAHDDFEIKAVHMNKKVREQTNYGIPHTGHMLQRAQRGKQFKSMSAIFIRAPASLLKIIVYSLFAKISQAIRSKSCEVCEILQPYQTMKPTCCPFLVILLPPAFSGIFSNTPIWHSSRSKKLTVLEYSHILELLEGLAEDSS